MTNIHYRTPTVKDSSTVHALVAQTKALDLNSWYYYAMFFQDFRQTCMVVDVNGELAGFVTGYIRPRYPDTLFLWQTATTLNHGISNLGLNLLDELIKSVQKKTDIRYVEATIDPRNKAIAMQFRLLARKLKAQKSEEIRFAVEDFVQLEHDEQLIRIGPLQ
ncbi:diaminobutyrate acetyltransferase [Mycobacteroides abscessus]|uniref:diaminobutyrate acetyltransferase n=1 Tax=Mycobacteroides abscessus TaxID=36809 RepID=UPI000C26B389|nr:diaminobutyrate acetyltransferase [Mycobacteroides abscessus]PVA97620.1 diaminobutyrate acetyltransferase [Mycobacteroides abscessus]QOF34628.1 diaminobutyrate acetyltransferase [Mycobacteroides abscessus]